MEKLAMSVGFMVEGFVKQRLKEYTASILSNMVSECNVEVKRLEDSIVDVGSIDSSIELMGPEVMSTAFHNSKINWQLGYHGGSCFAEGKVMLLVFVSSKVDGVWEVNHSTAKLIDESDICRSFISSISEVLFEIFSM